MHLGRTQLHYSTPMPKRPLGQRHEGMTTSDNEAAIRRAAGRPFDLNVRWALGTLRAAHSNKPGPDGYLFVDLPDGGRRPMTRAERRRTYDGWGLSRINTLSRANGERPLTLDEALELCVEHNAIPIKELKSRLFATSDVPYAVLKSLCKKHDVPVWSKTLATMWGLRGKVRRAHANGVPLAVIYGKSVRGRARRLARTRRLTRRWTLKPYATW